MNIALGEHTFKQQIDEFYQPKQAEFTLDALNPTYIDEINYRFTKLVDDGEGLMLSGKIDTASRNQEVYLVLNNVENNHHYIYSLKEHGKFACSWEDIYIRKNSVDSGTYSIDLLVCKEGQAYYTITSYYWMVS